MADCPECGGEMKWRNPFYICHICGLTLRRHEFERAWKKKDDDQWEERYGKDEDDTEKRRRETVDWYLRGDK